MRLWYPKRALLVFPDDHIFIIGESIPEDVDIKEDSEIVYD